MFAVLCELTQTISGGSRFFERLIERRGTKGRMATAHGHIGRAGNYRPLFGKGEAAAPSAPKSAITL